MNIVKIARTTTAYPLNIVTYLVRVIVSTSTVLHVRLECCVFKY